MATCRNILLLVLLLTSGANAGNRQDSLVAQLRNAAGVRAAVREPNPTCPRGGEGWNATTRGLRCFCPPGFHVNADHVCEDTHECESKKACPTYAACLNLKGSYNCQCQNGGTYKRGKCCIGKECDDNQKMNTIGFIRIAGKIVDADECLQDDACPKHASCINLHGGYDCKCPEGFDYKNYKCIDVNECARRWACPDNATCDNLVGSFKCTCPSGFKIIMAKSGPNYASRMKFGKCVDVDECSGSASCGKNSRCSNTIGSYECKCIRGFQKNENSQCGDKNECSDDPCPDNSNCENYPGGFDCSCKKGYLNINGMCPDANECLNPRTCGKKDFCVNVPGSYWCNCPTGFTNITGTCQDINECSLNPCGVGGENCINKPGSYRCHCKGGFRFIDGVCKRSCSGRMVSGVCVQEESCLINPCTGGARCLRKNGVAKCVCPRGYVFVHRTCMDIDECLRNPCKAVEKCYNTQGGFECCAKGTHFNEAILSCDSRDECKIPGICRGGAKCVNTASGFECVCAKGWKYSYHHGRCDDRNECLDGSENQEFVCPGQKCVNTAGSFVCKSSRLENTGYQMHKFTPHLHQSSVGSSTRAKTTSRAFEAKRAARGPRSTGSRARRINRAGVTSPRKYVPRRSSYARVVKQTAIRRRYSGSRYMPSSTTRLYG